MQRVIDYYNKFEGETSRQKITSAGCYRPTSIYNVVELFRRIEGGFDLSSCNTLVDAGGGDGRVAVVASLYGVRAISIESDKQTHKLAEERVGFLRNSGVFRTMHEQKNPLLILGDFLDTRTYQRSGINLADITHMFNAGDNERRVARFMNEYIRHSTYLILAQSNGELIENKLRRLITYKGADNRSIGQVYRTKYKLERQLPKCIV